MLLRIGQIDHRCHDAEVGTEVVADLSVDLTVRSRVYGVHLLKPVEVLERIRRSHSRRIHGHAAPRIRQTSRESRSFVVSDDVDGVLRYTRNRQIVAERTALRGLGIGTRVVRLEAEAKVECVLGANLETVDLP